MSVAAGSAAQQAPLSPSEASRQHSRSELAGLSIGALGDGGAVARAISCFNVRDGQQSLAASVADAIEGHGTLVAEAGTGTGKTFAYLVPLLLSGRKALVSTGTRHLQDQLHSRDVPAISRALGVDVRAAVLKGRANYVCHHHLERQLNDGRFVDPSTPDKLRRIAMFARSSESGDRAEFTALAEDDPAWAHATSTRENCLGQDCPESKRCFVFKARREAMNADLVVVNHHLFCADLALRDESIAELLPTADAVVFDEAHQLPDAATEFFGEAVSSRQLIDLSRDLVRAGLTEAADGADWRALSARFERSVRELRLVFGERAGGRGNFERVPLERLRRMDVLADALDALVSDLQSVAAVVSNNTGRGLELDRCGLRALELAHRVVRWRDVVLAGRAPGGGEGGANGEGVASGVGLDASGPVGGGEQGGVDARGLAPNRALDDRALDVGAIEGERPDLGASPLGTPDLGAPDLGAPDLGAPDLGAPDLDAEGPSIVWAEVGPQHVSLKRTPLSVAATFSRHRAGPPRAWIFLSATLSVGDDFGHFVEALGLDDAQCRRWQSPFDFERQAALWVPRGECDASSPDFPTQVANVAWPLLQANRGRAFFLCTTLRSMRQVAARLAELDRGAGSGLSLLVQGDAPRNELLRRFRSIPASVLVGSAGFWEGVDVAGDALSLVVIDKLPFAPPDDPIIQARSEALRRHGRDPFSHYQLPSAALALKQGAGRLIRSETDRGVLVVCDDRLVGRSYGRRLIASLPPFKRVTTLEEAMAFLPRPA